MSEYPVYPDSPPPISPIPLPSRPRLFWMVCLLMALFVLLILPYLVEQVQFAITRGEQRAQAEVARKLGLPCQVSLESPMACGLGICYSCVAKIRGASGQWDYRRTCVEGPVFEAEDVEF